LPVVDMGDDTEVADVILADVGEKYSARSWAISPDDRQPTTSATILLVHRGPHCPPCTAGSTPPPTAARYASPPTVICRPRAIPACVSPDCGAAISSPWRTGACGASTGWRPPP